MRILLISILFLAGCASSPSNKTLLTDVPNHWLLDGKIAIIYAEENCQKEVCPQKSDQGQLTWKQDGEDYYVQIADPFGKVLYNLHGNQQSAVIVSGDKKRYIPNPKEFLAKQLKINVKPSTLTYWLTGRVDPDLSSQYSDSDTFEQSGFSVQVNGWIETPMGKLPKRVNITNGEDRLKIVIKDWQ